MASVHYPLSGHQRHINPCRLFADQTGDSAARLALLGGRGVGGEEEADQENDMIAFRVRSAFRTQRLDVRGH